MGGQTVHIGIVYGRAPDSAIEGIDVHVHKLTSPFREMMRLVSIQFNALREAGVSLEDAIGMLRNSRIGGPEGTVEGFEGIERADSVPDLVAQMLTILSRAPTEETE